MAVLTKPVLKNMQNARIPPKSAAPIVSFFKATLSVTPITIITDNIQTGDSIVAHKIGHYTVFHAISC